MPSPSGKLLAPFAACALACTALTSTAFGAPGDIFTVAGNGTQSYCCDNGPATLAELNLPPAAVPTPDGGFLIPDFGNDRVRKVSPKGIITTVAGNGITGYMGDSGLATSAELHQPRGVTATPDGGYLIADRRNHVIRKVSSGGLITTVAGNNTPGFMGDNGPAKAAELSFPHALSLTPDGGYLIVDSGNQRIRKVSAGGKITTVAGNGTFGYNGDGIAATSAELSNPEGVAALPHGGFLVADTSDHRIRKVSPGGTITTVAGNGTSGYMGDHGPATSAELDFPEGVAPTADGGFLISDNDNNVIRKVSPSGTITTIVGNGTKGYMGDNGPAQLAELSRPEFVAITPPGGLLIADHDNEVIRRVAGPVAPIVAAPAASTAPHSPSNKLNARVLGTAATGSFVALYKSPKCSGAPLAHGSAAAFHSPGFAIHVAPNSTTTFHAVVYAAGGQLSSCPKSTITYVEDSIAPKASITKHPKHTVVAGGQQTEVTFSFKSNEHGSRFRCRLDKGSYHSCHSPKTYTVGPGHHTFRVRAIDRAGNVSRAARFRFRVV
jgi:NHL repeat